MGTENLDNTDIIEETGEEVIEEPQYSPEELQAMEHGWAPKDDWKGDESDWVSAKEFNRRGELFGKIKNLERDRDSLRQATKHMKDLLARAKETEYNNAIRDLKAQKKAAAEEADTGKMLEIDDEIEVLKNDHQQFVQQVQSTPEPVEINDVFVGWQQQNPWYTQDADMRVFADGVGQSYAANNPNASAEELFEAVDKQIKKAYPEKFTNPRRSSPSKVESTTKGGASSSKSKFSAKDLDDTQRDVMKTMVRSGVMTEEEYIKELVRVGAIG